ncbi:MAG: long-chain fatty acid--CoA ligase [Bacteroidetes bacterium]|nr:long-chain fatty acid--CoA ligase [Bacteroidota bacterium]
MHADFLTDAFEKYSGSPALVWNGRSYDYKTLLEIFNKRSSEIKSVYNLRGKVTALKSDFSPESVCLMLALIENECITVPLNRNSKENENKISDIAMCEWLIETDENDNVSYKDLENTASHILYDSLKEKNHPGLVLFSSGTSGIPKAAVHDFTNLLEKFKTQRTAFYTLNFLLFDHWGGLNTMFHTLSNGGLLVFTNDRTPENVCSLIEKHKIELLPASPTFLNLLLLSEAYKKSDLSSLKIISYGTEPMLPGTLKRLNNIFPGVKFRQTYGLIEIGVMRSSSLSNDSLWVKLGGEGYTTRVVDNILQVKSSSSILGYLNYPSPFTEDGWFITEDYVETDGEYFRILGRKTDLMNIGGEKVYPAEIEDVLKELENVAEAIVYSEPNSITGNIICAEVTMIKDADKNEFKSKIRKHCRERLENFKVPSRIIISDKIDYTERFKKKKPVNNRS